MTHVSKRDHEQEDFYIAVTPNLWPVAHLWAIKVLQVGREGSLKVN